MATTTIGADAAKLAGLQIDYLQKLRSGQVTLDHFEWFLGLTKEERDSFLGGKITALPSIKFAEVPGLSWVIEVPADYDHGTRLGSFIKKNRQGFYYVNDAITDQNFSRTATTQLTPGRKIRVTVYKQTVSGSTTSSERMDFLRQQPGNVFLGAHGITLVWDKREELPRGKWYCSFDEKNALWQDAGGRPWVPSLDCDSDGDFKFRLGAFEADWDDGHCLLGFSDVSA